MFNKKNNVLNLIYAFAGGLVVGGAVALLVTPLPGKKMQKKVADVADRVIDKVEAVRKMATA